MRRPTRAARLGWRRRLIDTYIESYVDWRERCADVRRAYQGWTLSEPRDCGWAFRVYRAALEREERAALAHERAVAQFDRRARR
ncbi:MAG TPA: hypothetical protein VFT42_09730 [Solirubrobacteraceae bacterium]|nr:hypothetical protein [Solirubrobacteraceae bacterium]